jgi:CheY-like chemotaxis protein
MPTSVLIADDPEFMRNLLREIFEGEFEIVGEAEMAWRRSASTANTPRTS